MDVGLFSEINYQAVLVGTLAYYLLGVIWYSKFFFGSAWRQLVGLTADMYKGTEAIRIQLMVVASLLITSLVIAVLIVLTDSVTVFSGLFLGAFIGLGLVGTTSLVSISLARWPRRLLSINAGYHIMGIILVSIILSLWR